MTALDILKECQQKGIILTPKGNRLRYVGPESEITEELLAKLKKYKPELLAVLNVLETFDGIIVEESKSIH